MLQLIVERGLELIDAGETPTTSAGIIREEMAPFDEKTLWFLQFAGIQQILHEAKHRRNQGHDPVSRFATEEDEQEVAEGQQTQTPRSGKFHPHRGAGTRTLIIWLSSITLNGADGVDRPIAKFTVEDWQSYAVVTDAQFEAWGERREFAAQAQAALAEHEKSCLAELPKKEIAKFEVLAGATWGKVKIKKP